MQAVLLLALTAQAAKTFTFSGGSDNELLNALSEELHKPLVMLASQRGTWKKAKIQYQSVSDAIQKIRGQFGLAVDPNGGAFTSAFPRGMGYIIYWEGYRSRLARAKIRDDFSDGTVDLRTVDNQVLSLYDISNLGLSKRLTWERFFERVRLRICASRITEEELLKAVATAVGGKCVVGRESYKLVIEPKQYRARSLALWRAIESDPEDALQYANAKYMLALLPSTSDRMISQAFDDPERPGGWGQFWPKNSLVHDMAWRRAGAYYAAMGAEPDATFRRVADPRFPILGYIEDTGYPRIGYRNPETQEIVIQ